MNNPIKSYFIRGVALISLTALIAGCAHESSSQTKTTPSTACTSNPYLMKYHCSIHRVETAAENGNPDAQYALGYMYYYGINTAQDQETAGLWIQRAAAQGQPLAKKAWSLINTGATFTDLHQAASNEVTKTSQTSSTIEQQEPANVDQMNATKPHQPITSVLPAYQLNQSSQNTTSTFASTISNSTIASNPANTYTVQLMASNQLGDVKAFIADHHLGNQAHYFKTQLNGKPWYMLTYGKYPTQQQAEAALKNMSPSLLSNHPWVKSVAIVQQEVKLQKVIA